MGEAFQLGYLEKHYPLVEELVVRVEGYLAILLFREELAVIAEALEALPRRWLTLEISVASGWATCMELQGFLEQAIPSAPGLTVLSALEEKLRRAVVATRG